MLKEFSHKKVSQTQISLLLSLISKEKQVLLSKEKSVAETFKTSVITIKLGCVGIFLV